MPGSDAIVASKPPYRIRPDLSAWKPTGTIRGSDSRWNARRQVSSESYASCCHTLVLDGQLEGLISFSVRQVDYVMVEELYFV
jgi:hypothetical protein